MAARTHRRVRTIARMHFSNTISSYIVATLLLKPDFHMSTLVLGALCPSTALVLLNMHISRVILGQLPLGRSNQYIQSTKRLWLRMHEQATRRTPAS